MPRIPKPVKTAVETLLWVGVLALAAYRFGPQLGAALGLGGRGSEAPPYAIATLDGSEISLEDLRGQVVLLNIWATWCGPCRIEMPGFQDVFEEYRTRGFTILGVSRDGPGSEVKVRAFLEAKGITYPVAMETASSRAALRAIGESNALPTSFLIDRAGRIRHKVEGIFVEPTLRMAVKRLLDEG
jgi:peroxiredoxin